MARLMVFAEVIASPLHVHCRAWVQLLGSRPVKAMSVQLANALRERGEVN
jgi:hypothetical protein